MSPAGNGGISRSATGPLVAIVASYADSLIVFRGPLIRAMLGRGCRVLACAPDASPAVAARLAEWGAGFEAYPLARTSANPMSDLRTLVALAGLFRRTRPDMVLSYTIKPVIYASIAARLAGVPAVFSMVTGLGYAFTGTGPRRATIAALVRRLCRIALNGNRCVFFQNPDDRRFFLEQRLLATGARSEIVNGSGVDLEHYAPAPMPRERVFLMVARLLADKGVREYVEAARMVRREHPQARFMLAGWIDDNPSAIGADELNAWIAEGTVDYLGKLEDVRPAMEACSAYVLPSYREGTPRTVLEAMAMGRPVITTDVPGCRETIRPGVNGLLVPARSASAVAEAMRTLIREPDLGQRMGRESRRLAQEKYDVHRVNADVLSAMGIA